MNKNKPRAPSARWQEKVQSEDGVITVQIKEEQIELPIKAGQIHWRAYPKPVWSGAMRGGCYASAVTWVKSLVDWAEVSKKTQASWRAAPLSIAVAYGREHVTLSDSLDPKKLRDAVESSIDALAQQHPLPLNILDDATQALRRCLEGHLNTKYERGWPQVIVSRAEVIAWLDTIAEKNA